MRKQALAGFSGGMRQRFGIAQALIGNPSLVIVDEPTAGLDPEERNRFLNLLAEIGENVVVILSTHIVDDVSDLCQRMAIIASGRIVRAGAPLELVAELAGRVWRKTIDKGELDVAPGRSRSDLDAACSAVARSFTCWPIASRSLVSSQRRANSRTSTSRRCHPCGARPERTSMFRHIAAFELRYHLRSPVFWTTTLLFALLTFGAITSDQVQIGSTGNVKKNSPYAIAKTLVIMSIFAVFIMAAFVSNVVVRDDETGYGPIVRSTRVSTFDYLFGRFTGAFVVGCLAFAGVPLAMLIGSFMPWIDPDTLGPFRPGDYAYVYFLLCVPTLLMMGAFCFALATMTRSMPATYVGVVALLMIYFVSTAFFRRPEYERIVALVEPFGIGAFTLATKYWTAAERNTPIACGCGVILWNRLIWLGAGMLLLGAAWAFFRREGKRVGRRKAMADEALVSAPRAALPTRGRAASGFSRISPGAASTTGRQLLALARFDMAAVFRSPAFFVLLAFGFLNSIAALWFANEDLYGNPFYPVTRIMIQTLDGTFSIVPLIVAIYYAGDLVWRDRELRLHEMLHSSPAPDWAFALPKVLAIALVLLATVAASVVGALAVQTLRGYGNYEFDKYLTWYVLPRAIDVTLYCGSRRLHSGAGAPQVHRLAGDAAGDRGADRARPTWLRAQPVSIRRLTSRPAVGHERSGALRRVRGLVSRVLGRGCGAARVADLRVVATRPVWIASRAAQRPCRTVFVAHRPPLPWWPALWPLASAATSSTTPTC